MGKGLGGGGGKGGAGGGGGRSARAGGGGGAAGLAGFSKTQIAMLSSVPAGLTAEQAGMVGAFNRLQYANSASIADLREATGSKSFDATFNSLRRQGVFSATSGEKGMSAKDLAGGLPEPHTGKTLVRVTRRDVSLAD